MARWCDMQGMPLCLGVSCDKTNHSFMLQLTSRVPNPLGGGSLLPFALCLPNMSLQPSFLPVVTSTAGYTALTTSPSSWHHGLRPPSTPTCGPSGMTCRSPTSPSRQPGAVSST
jgi:hypothetical protein